MNGKIDSNFALVIFLLVAVVFLFIFWMINERDVIDEIYNNGQDTTTSVESMQTPDDGIDSFLTQEEMGDPLFSDIINEDLSGDAGFDLDEIDGLSELGELNFEELEE